MSHNARRQPLSSRIVLPYNERDMSTVRDTPGTQNVLIIAFHFPPQRGSSGLLRTLKFCRYLPEFGWKPTVLTAHLRAYESIETSGVSSIPADLPVFRAQAWDAKRHLGFRGHYVGWMALPDRWVSWLIAAIPAGLRLIRKRHIDVIFSTFPIASALLLAYALHRLSGKPWVVDLRDSMTEEGYPREPRARQVWRWIERKAMQRADRVIFTAASTRRMYLNRYPRLRPDNCLLIPNGFDEEDFWGLLPGRQIEDIHLRPLKLLHTGLLYPEERDPRPFFRALARLKHDGVIASDALKIVFRAPGSEDLYHQLIREFGINELIELQEHVPYKKALQECAEADGLLLFQAANCDHQIPAKAYEYLRLRKPIFALTTYTGDTAALLNEVGGATIAELADEDDIYDRLPRFLEALRAATHPLPDTHRIQHYARRNQAEQLAKCFSDLNKQTSSLAAERLPGLTP